MYLYIALIHPINCVYVHLCRFSVASFFDSFEHPTVFTFSSIAINISNNLISLGSLFNMYPPLVPLILLTKLFFFNFKKFVLNKVMKYFVVKIYP